MTREELREIALTIVVIGLCLMAIGMVLKPW
jgi:hypothetical protein